MITATGKPERVWRECRLGDHVLINSRSIDKNYPHTEIEYLDTGSITQGKIETLQHFQLADAPSRAKRIVKDDDIVLSMVRPIQRHYGFLKNVLPNMIASTGFVVLTCKDDVDPYFLYSFLTQEDTTEYLDMIAEGATSTYPAFTPDVVENISINLPPLPEQRAIAAVLSSLDDKIDFLHRQNNTLEGMVFALWRKMFIEEAAPVWKKGKLGDIAEINPLRSLKKGQVATYLDMANMPTSGTFPLDWIPRCYTSGMKFKNGDTIIARITPCLENGKTAYINFLNDNEIAWGSTEYVVLSSKTGVCSEWFYFLARYNDFRDFAIQNMTGTSGRQRVSGDSISQYEMAIPPIKVSDEFKLFAVPVMEHIKRNSLQIRTLSKTRDTLLPKLMSGEVRVRI